MINEQSLKDRLQAIARERNIPFNACWKHFLLERFLTRLAKSDHSQRFIFKGGFLLSYLLKIGRETTDLDFLLTRMRAEEQELRETITQIISTPSLDGFTFSFDSIELLQQPHMDYLGYRITLRAAFSRMKDRVQIDIGVGDVVEPVLREIPLTHYRGLPFFESAVSLLVYPVETIFAEKLETILTKGTHNSRMKDYHDLVLLIRSEGMLNEEKLKEAIDRTFSNRDTDFRSIEFTPDALSALQKLWTAHLHNLGDGAGALNLPRDISDAVTEINGRISMLTNHFGST